MTDLLYDPIVLAHARAPRGARLPADATTVAREVNPLCGDQADVAVTLDGGVVTDLGFEVKGCAVCIASASVMGEAVRGRSLAEVSALRERFEARTRGEGDPSLVSHDVEAVATAARLPGRRACGLLPWSALARALDPPPRAVSTGAVAPERVDGDTDPLALAARWIERGRTVALATLVSAVGAGPCPPGSTMVVDASGAFFGSVSGGCVEGTVVREAIRTLEEGSARLLDFSAAGDGPWGVGLPCGGRVEVLVAPAEAPWLDALLAQRRARRAATLATRLRDARRVIVGEEAPPEGLPEGLLRAAETVRDGAPARVWEGDGERWFLQPFHAPRRLVLVGGVHIAQALVSVAGLLGMEPVVVDPRACFVGGGRFPAVEVHAAWPDEALTPLLDERSAVVVLTHDAKLDDPALAAALRSSAFYIGALGSRKTQAARRARLLAQGFTERDLARIHGPVGLAIGAVGPGEIALSIAAEIVRERRLAATQRGARIGAVILAAGMSARMGARNKLLADVRGEPMVRGVVRAALDAGASPVVVVTGHEAHAVGDALAGLPVEFVTNPRYREGMGTSVAAGAAALEGRVDAAVVALGDMPMVRAEHIRRLLARHDPSTTPSILVPVHAGRRGNPVLWPARYLPELAGLSGDVGGRTLLARHAAAVQEVPFEDDGIHRDVDDAGDLAALVEVS